MKLCVNCKHREFGGCFAPQSYGKPDLVYGRREREHSCERHRDDGFIRSLIANTCGKRGRWFEPRQEANKEITK